MYVYHFRREGQTTFILQFWAQSIQNVRECKSYNSCEIRHNYSIFDCGVQRRGINATPYVTGDPVWVGDGVVPWWLMGGGECGGGGGVVVVVLGGFLCSSSPTTSRDKTWTPNCWNYQAFSYISELIWCDPWNIWGPIWHSFLFGLLISFDRPYPRVQYIRNERWRKFCDSLSPDWTFGVLIYFINDEGSTATTTAWPNQVIVAFDGSYPWVQYIQKLRWCKT